jgi:hypothetical protein
LVNRVIKTLYEDDRAIVDIEGNAWQVWYPLERVMEVENVNRRMKR